MEEKDLPIYIVNTFVTDDVVMQGARTSAVMTLIYFPGDNLDEG